MSIAHQPAMPSVPPRRPRRAPLKVAPPRRPGVALAKLGGLVVLTALGAAMLSGAVGLAIIMFATSVGG